MLLTPQNLQIVYTGFNASFLQGLEAAKPMWQSVAMKISSQTREEEYAFGHAFAGIREWVGDRVVHGLGVHSFKIKNRPFEQTIEIDRDDIADDRVGVHGPVLKQMGADAALHPDTLVFPLLADGFTGAAYDGQFFFDTDHPVIDENGVEQSVANTDGGSGAPWFLIDTSKSVRPIVYQERQVFSFVRKDRPDDDNTFLRRKYLYGIDGRSNVGFGLWQVAWGSKQDLTADNYAAARAAMMSFTRDGGTRLGIMPDLLVVGPSLEAKARQLLMGGDRVEEPGTGFFVSRSNEWKDSATLVVTPFL